jgi:hypothetical protein
VARDPEVKRFAEEVGGQCVFYTEHNQQIFSSLHNPGCRGGRDHWVPALFHGQCQYWEIIAKEFK